MKKLIIAAVILISNPAFSQTYGGGFRSPNGDVYTTSYGQSDVVQPISQPIQQPQRQNVPDVSRSYVPEPEPYPTHSTLPEPPAPYHY